MDMFDFAGLLFGGSRTAPQGRSVTATGAASSADGVARIRLDADVTPAEDEGVDEDGDQTIIDLPTSPDVDEGDELIVTLVGDGPLKTPVVTANPGSGDRMRALATSAKTVADAAQAVAEAVNQHFFSDTNGIHVTEATQEDWDENHSGANVLINSIGQLFRDGLNNLLTLTTENGARALTIWDGLGNTADNIRAIIGETIQLGNRSSGYNVTIEPSSIDFNKGTSKVYGITAYAETVDGEYTTVTTNRGTLEYGAAVGSVVEGEEAHFLEKDGSSESWDSKLTLKALDNHRPDGESEAPWHEPLIELRVNRSTSSGESSVTSYATIMSETWVVWDLQNTAQGHIDRRNYIIDSHDAAIGLRHPEASYTGTNTTNTATAAGWRLTYFNTILASVGSPGLDFHFSNGVIQPTRDICVEISGVMHWRDTVAGQRGFGIFSSATPGSGTECSVFQNWAASSSAEHKSLVFPARTFNMTAGSQWSVGRYEPNGAIYTNGTNMSWVTIRVVG